LIPAQIATASGLVTAMHDPTEGGVITGLRELAQAGNVGLEIDLDAIPVPDLAVRLCAEFGLDPLGTIASGALLATAPAPAVRELCGRWQAAGWPAAVIGRVVPTEQGMCAQQAGQPVEFPAFVVDEIMKLWL
jgi:hydrogenase expression/formation protein HypE